MGVGDFIDKQILELVERKLTGTGVSLEQFVEEALLTKLAAPSHRTLKVETILRIFDTAAVHGNKDGFKEKFLHFHFDIKVHKGEDDPWDEMHQYDGPNGPLEGDKKWIAALIDLRKPQSKKAERPAQLDFFLE